MRDQSGVKTNIKIYYRRLSLLRVRNAPGQFVVETLHSSVRRVNGRLEIMPPIAEIDDFTSNNCL
jgi:hypothetical protein